MKALVVGAFVRGLSMREVEFLCEKAGLGKLSKSTASRMCEELKERFEAFKRRSLYDMSLVALFLDATYVSVRPSGPKEGVLMAWGFTEDGERVLLSVMLGMRESHNDWQELARDLIARGMGAPMLIVADGAPGLIKAIEQCWPASDRQRRCVHRAQNLYSKLPERERERVKHAYWRALDDEVSEQDAKQRLQALVDQLANEGFTAASRCLAEDLGRPAFALVVAGRVSLSSEPYAKAKSCICSNPANRARCAQATDGLGEVSLDEVSAGVQALSRGGLAGRRAGAVRRKRRRDDKLDVDDRGLGWLMRGPQDGSCAGTHQLCWPQAWAPAHSRGCRDRNVSSNDDSAG